MERQRGGRRISRALASVALAVGAISCASAQDTAVRTTDWRQAMIEAPQQPDQAAFCDTLAGRLEPEQVDTIVLFEPGLADAQIVESSAAAEQITGTPGRYTDEAAMRSEFAQLFASMPDLIDDAVLDRLGARLEFAPIDQIEAAAIDALPGIEHVLVPPPNTIAMTPRVLDTLALLWPSRLAGADLILFIRPAEGDGPLTRIRGEIEADHADTIRTIDLMTQDESMEEFTELFANAPEMLSSVSPEILPASIRLTGSDEDGLAAIHQRYHDDPRISDVVRVGSSALAVRPIAGFLGEDLAGRDQPALPELARTAPEALAPDVAALIEAFPAPDRLAMTGLITGPGDDVAIPRPIWEQARPSVERIITFADETCGLAPARR